MKHISGKITVTLLTAVLTGIAAFADNPKPFVIPEIREWKGSSGNFTPGEKVNLAICGDNKSTSLYVNGNLYESMGIKKCIYEGASRPTYQVRTLAFPLGKACEFHSRITDFKVYNTGL